MTCCFYAKTKGGFAKLLQIQYSSMNIGSSQAKAIAKAKPLLVSSPP